MTPTRPFTILEKSGQFRVAVVDELALALGQRVDAVSQGQQGAVDVGALLQPLAAILHDQDERRIIYGYFL